MGKREGMGVDDGGRGGIRRRKKSKEARKKDEKKERLKKRGPLGRLLPGETEGHPWPP